MMVRHTNNLENAVNVHMFYLIQTEIEKALQVLNSSEPSEPLIPD